MGKVEIKIRKKILTPDNLQQYRNYPALLKKYKHNKRFKRALKIFLYSIALTVFVLTLIFISMWKVLLDKGQESSERPKTYTYLRFSGNRQDTVEHRSFTHYKTDSFYTVSYQYDTFKLMHRLKLPVRPELNDTTYTVKDSSLGERITYEREKTIQVEGQDYVIIKYLIAHTGMDLDAFIFYSPDFGLLHVRSRTWGNYRRLINTGNAKNDKIIQQLTQNVERDEAFFKSRNP